MVVKVQVYIDSITKLDTKDLEVTITGKYRMKWVDQRLRHTYSSPILVSHKENMDKVWNPEVIIRQSGECCCETEGKILLTVSPDGEMVYESRFMLFV